MQAAAFDSSFDLKLKDVAPPAPGLGEVEIRVAAVGLCAGDRACRSGLCEGGGGTRSCAS